MAPLTSALWLLLICEAAHTLALPETTCNTPSAASRAYCSTSAAPTDPSGSPAYRFSEFSFTKTEVIRVAKSNPPRPRTTFAKPYSAVSQALGRLSSTTWPNWTPENALPTNNADPYGDAAYSTLWNAAAPVSFSRDAYSTTASPTPVPSSELVYPPPLVFGPDNCYLFPEDFVFGVAGSASQCEGAVADHGKSPAITDMLGTLLALNGSGSANNYVTNEHYYLYKQDIERFAAIGTKYYSFSIPWTRVLPFALRGTPVNSKAIEHYSDVIDFVLSKGMQPIVTLTHFDTPLQFFGGGSEYISQAAGTRNYYAPGLGQDLAYNNATLEDAFVNYAQIVMSHYASRVPIWITFNEPQLGCTNGIAVNTVIKAHARVVHFYRETLNGTGRVSMKMGITPGIPLDASDPAHVAAAETFTDLYVNAFLNPLALGLDYPDAFKWALQDHVPLTARDLEYLSGTLDFIALDAYIAPIISPLVPKFKECAGNNATANAAYNRFPICLNTSMVTTTGWANGYSPDGSSTDYIAPLSLRTQLNYVWNKFKLPVYISEFGLELPYPTGNRLVDNVYNAPQSVYLLSYLNEVLKAIWEDGVNVLGAMAWNWGDDWEFTAFDTGFGLQYINHSTQERVYRRSFFDVVDFVNSRQQH